MADAPQDTEGSPAPGAETSIPTTKVEDKNFFHLTLIIIFGIFATTLPQPQVLGRLAISKLLMDNLHLQAHDVAGFFFLCGIAWYFKPIAGILTDAFPFFGTRRRHYMLFSSVLAAVSWMGLFFLWQFFGARPNADPHTAFNALLWGAIIVNVFMVMASTVTGAFLVEAGQSYGATGRLTSVRMFVQNFAGAINGYLGGLLASTLFLYAAGVNAIFIFSLFPITYIFMRERKVRQGNAVAFQNAGRQLGVIGKSSTLWWGLVFIFFFYFAPGFTTLQLFRQRHELHFEMRYIGLLGTYAGVAGLLSSVVYGYFIKKFNLRTMLFIGIATAGVGSLLYLPRFYTNASIAIPIECQNGFFFTLAEIALMDLAARATPVGCEGLGYSLILSIRNVALLGADALGSWFADKQHIPFEKMVFVNSGTTLFVLILLPFLPAAIMRTKDKAAASEPDPELRPAEDDI